MVNDSENGLHSQDVVGDDEALKHVNLSSLHFIIAVLLIPESKSSVNLSLKAYLFSSNQLSTLVFTSNGSPKLEGREEVTQCIFLSVVSRLLVSFLFLR